MPVYWVKLVLAVYLIFFLGNYFFKQVMGNTINQILLGTGLFVSVYIILFGGFNYLLFIALMSIIIIPVYFITNYLNNKYNTYVFSSFNLLGVIVLLPYIIIIWLVWQARESKMFNRAAIFILPLLLLIIGLFMTYRMGVIINKINSSDTKIITTKIIIENDLDKYLTELILGAHWKYHTKICIYDGWRPPYHNPILGFAQPFLYLGRHINYELDLQERKELYKNIFPDKPIIFDCKCAKNERLFFNRL
jgi:hypothetical protein